MSLLISNFVQQVYLDGELTHTRESYTGSTFNSLGVGALSVSNVMIESVHLLPEEWISLLEVCAELWRVLGTLKLRNYS